MSGEQTDAALAAEIRNWLNGLRGALRLAEERGLRVTAIESRTNQFVMCAVAEFLLSMLHEKKYVVSVTRVHSEEF